MAYYRQVGEVPGKRHTAFRDEAGALRYEELMGEEGFSSDSSLLYHRGVPSAIVDSQVWELPDLTVTPNHPLKPRHLKLHTLFARGPRPASTPCSTAGWCSATATCGSPTWSRTRSRRTTATRSATSACTSSRAAAPWRPCSACCPTGPATT